MREESVQKLLNEAAEWRLIGILFQCPEGSWRHQVNALAEETQAADLRAAAKAANKEASAGLYHSIFGPGGPAPPREVSYRDWAQPGYLISELTSYYQAFSYHPEMLEAADHVSVEAGFIAYLRLKEAYALARSDFEHADIAAEASRQFIEDHLSVYAQRLATALENSNIRYLALAGAALQRRAGLPKNKPAPLELPVLSDGDASAFDCGES
jgi:nitrate reductase assembly molybdenum cofactor insertion protein NarJ